VRFVLARDRHGRFRFAALQSAPGQKLLAQCGLSQSTFDSFVLVDAGRCYTESSAALHLATGLGGLWRLMALFWVVPRPFRDAVYRWVARNRYRWFGRRESCLLPTPEMRSRFLSE
jgi:predicted DCC family thiol-disulfide oxidoreductase YuxK